MRVALVHDYLKEYGGAERVLEALHEIWPEAPVFTSVYLPEYLGPHADRFKDWQIKTSFFQNIPFREKLISPMRLFSSFIFQSWDFSGYDLIIVSASGAYIPNLIIKKPGSLHLCYCHTPPRYLYGYPTARNWRKTIAGRILGELVNHRLRLTDFLASQRPDYYLANSREVKNRIRKFYKREATVIYPPVSLVDNVGRIDLKKKGDYYLTGGRLARAKHIELAIEAANLLKFPLKIFGKTFAGYEEELKKLAGPWIEFLGEIAEDKLIDLYRNCRALIYPSEFEDLGIIPVEAQAFGKAVIAYRSGGVVETVIDGKTGIFFDELTVDSLISAIKKLEKLKINSQDCFNNAQKYSKARFKKEIVNFIKNARTS